MPPIENREEILNWYQKFQKQMKEEFGLDLNRKTDLFRFRTVARRDEDGAAVMKYAFMRQNGGVYETPAPALDMDAFNELAHRFESTASMTRDEAQAIMAEIRRGSERMQRERHQWELGSQTFFNPERGEDMEQIARLYESARNGSLFIAKSESSASLPLYLGDDGRMHTGPRADAPLPRFEIAPGRSLDMTHLFRYDNAGRKEITDNMTRSQREDAERRNQAIDYLDRIFPDRRAVAHEDYEAFSVSALNGNVLELPEPVPKPGIMAYLRWIFSGFRDNSEFDAYDRYVAERDQRLDRREKVARAETEYKKMESLLVSLSGKVEGAADRDRAYQIYKNQDALGSVYSHPFDTEVTAICNALGAEKMRGADENDFTTLMNLEASNTLAEIEEHPEYFNPNGTRTAAGRTAYKNRTCTPEEKEAALAGYREQLEKAKQETLDALEQTFEGEYIAAHTAENAPFEQTLGILLYINAMQERTQKGDLFRECEMKADDIKASGRALTGTGAFRALTAEMPDIRQYVYDFAEMERTAPHDLKAEYATLSGKLAAHRKALAEQPKKGAPEKQAEKEVEEPKISVPSNGI